MIPARTALFLKKKRRRLASEEKELEENPKKDEPLGDEKKDFTKELKKNWEDVYPEKAHAKMNELADQLSESVTVLGDKFSLCPEKSRRDR